MTDDLTKRRADLDAELAAGLICKEERDHALRLAEEMDRRERIKRAGRAIKGAMDGKG